MTHTALLAASGLIAAGIVGGAIATRPSASQDDPRALIAQATAPYDQRIAALEARLRKAEQDRDAAQREAAEALSTAMETRRELDRVRGLCDDIMGTLAETGGAPHGRAPAAGGSAAGAGGVLLGDALPEPSTPATLASGGLPAYAKPDSAQVAAVKEALTEIRKQEQQDQQRQREERRQQMMQRRLADLQQRLGLTPEQTQQISAIWEDMQAKRQQLFESMRGGDPGMQMDRQQMRDAMTALRTEEEQKLQQTLTPEQFTQYQQIQQQDQGGRRGGGGFMGGGGGGRGGRMGGGG
jgi:hypothetical protein